VAIKPSKNTLINDRFRIALKYRVNLLAKTQVEVANKLGIAPGTLNNFMKKGASAATMEEIAAKLGLDLLDMLAEGRRLLETDAPPAEKPKPAKAATPLAAAPADDAEKMDLLRENRQLRLKIERLERELSEALGENVPIASDIRAVPFMSTLKQED
jgi:transcriptional regulator with XRE-family HTH domain